MNLSWCEVSFDCWSASIRCVEAIVHDTLTSKRYPPSEFPFRTTICLQDSGWEMVEHCARYINKDPAMLRPLEAPAALSVLSRDWVIRH